MKENKVCEICHKAKQDVRFEGLTESFICDECLFKYKKKEGLK